jgi:hypothetical protein
MSLHGRLEYADGGHIAAAGNEDVEGMALTGTLQYDLWANVLSRLEIRWDHSMGEPDAFQGGESPDYITLLANFVYKF